MWWVGGCRLRGLYEWGWIGRERGGRGWEHRVISACDPSRIPTVASPRPTPPPDRHSRKLLSCPCRSRCNTPGVITCTLYVCYPLMAVLRLSPPAPPRLSALFICLHHSVFVLIFGATGMRIISVLSPGLECLCLSRPRRTSLASFPSCSPPPGPHPCLGGYEGEQIYAGGCSRLVCLTWGRTEGRGGMSSSTEV